MIKGEGTMNEGNGSYSDEQHDVKDYMAMGREGEGSEPEQMRKLFIGGLDYRTTDESLKEYYSKWGKIVDVVVMKDSKTMRSRGFGFVTYSESSMVDIAMASRPHVVDGRNVEAKRAVRREDNGKPEVNMTVKKIFIGGLKDDATDEALREYFSQFGNVVASVHVTEKGTDKKRGFGFVEFDDYDAVDKCCLLHDEHQINGKRIDVKKAISKEDMEKRGGGRMGRESGGSWGSRGSRGRGGGGGRDRDGDDWGRGGRDFEGRSGGRGGRGGRGNFGRDEERYGGGSFGRGGSGGRGAWDDDDGWNNGSRGGGGGYDWDGSGGGDRYGGGGGSYGGGGSRYGGGDFDGGYRSGGGGRYSPPASFGDRYQQGYGGGPIRGGGSGGRPGPYSGGRGGRGGGGGGYRDY